MRGNDWKGAAGCAAQAARIAWIAVRGFGADRCVLRATALALLTVLALVPLAAAGTWIVHGPGAQRYIQGVAACAGGLHDPAMLLFSVVGAAAAHGHYGLSAGYGAIVFFCAIAALLAVTEQSLNAIWKTAANRSFSRRVAAYLFMTVIGIVLLGTSMGVSVFVTAYVHFAAQKVPFLAPVGRTLLGVLSVVPFFADWLLFAGVYLIMPSIAVPFSAGIIAGAVAAIAFQSLQRIYPGIQADAFSRSAGFCGGAALPLFLIRLQLSWAVVLLGGEFSRAICNRRA